MTLGRTIYRALGVVAIFYLGISAVFALQRAFDHGDLKKADAYFVKFSPPRGAGKTLKELMASEMGATADQLTCSEDLVSRYEGKINIDCHLAETNGGATTVYAWQIEVVGFQIQARNDAAREFEKKYF